jgi:hypothetical protein
MAASTDLERTRVEVEPQCHGDQTFEELRIHRPDIRASSDGHVVYIDVSIAEPTATVATAPAEGSHRVLGKAAELAEVRKLEQYPIDFLANNTLVPFCLESTGQLGQKAKFLLSKICRENPQLERRFLKDLSCILATCCGRSSSYCRSRQWRELTA